MSLKIKNSIMDRPLIKILSIVLYVLLGVSAIMGIIFYFGPLVDGTADTNYEEPLITNTILMWTYVLSGIAIVATLLFSVLNMVKDPKSAKTALIGIGSLIIIMVVGWLSASSDILVNPDLFDITGPISKLIGGGLIGMYILGAIAFLGIIYTEVIRVFK